MCPESRDDLKDLGAHDANLVLVLFAPFLIRSEIVLYELDRIVIYLEIGIVELDLAFSSVCLINRHRSPLCEGTGPSPCLMQ